MNSRRTEKESEMDMENNKSMVRTFDMTGFEEYPDIGCLKIMCELLTEMEKHDEVTGLHSVGAALYYINSKFGD